MRRRWIPRVIRGGESLLPPRLRPRRIPRDAVDEALISPAIPGAGRSPSEPDAPDGGEETTPRDTPRRATA